MSHCRIPLASALWLALAIAPPAAGAQVFESNTKQVSGASFAFRMQRQEENGARCVIVYPGRRVHLENRIALGTRVLEGVLPEASVTQLANLLPAVREIDANDISNKKMQLQTLDILIVNVPTLRGGLNNLQFQDPDSRKPFRAALDPLLKWFSDVQKQHLATVADSKANNCMPIAEDAASEASRPSEAATSSAGARPARPMRYEFLLHVNIFSSDEGVTQNRCVAVAPDGRYRYETRLESHSGGGKSKGLEGHLDESELAKLRELLDEPVFRGSTHNPDMPSGVFSRNTEIVEFAVPREDHLQQLRFYSITGAAGYYNEVGVYQPGGTQSDTDYKLVKPLRSWIKDHIEKRKGASPIPGEAFDNCSLH